MIFSGREYLKALPAPQHLTQQKYEPDVSTAVVNNKLNGQSLPQKQNTPTTASSQQKRSNSKGVGRPRKVTLIKESYEGLGISITVFFLIKF